MTASATRPTSEPEPWFPEQFIAHLRAPGTRDRDRHPLHRRMDAGHLARQGLQRWVANRFEAIERGDTQPAGPGA